MPQRTTLCLSLLQEASSFWIASAIPVASCLQAMMYLLTRKLYVLSFSSADWQVQHQPFYCMIRPRDRAKVRSWIDSAKSWSPIRLNDKTGGGFGYTSFGILKVRFAIDPSDSSFLRFPEMESLSAQKRASASVLGKKSSPSKAFLRLIPTASSASCVAKRHCIDRTVSRLCICNLQDFALYLPPSKVRVLWL